MNRRTFLGAATAAVVANGIHFVPSYAEPETPKLKPMALGLIINPYRAPEATIKRVRDMGFSNCFLSLDGYIGKFTPEAAKQIGDLLAKYNLVATAVEVVGPPPLAWNFMEGLPPSVWCRLKDALRISMLSGKPRISPSCWASSRFKRTVGLFRRIRPTLSIQVQ